MADLSQHPDLGRGGSDGGGSTLSILWLLLTTRPLIGVMLALAVVFFTVFLWQCRRAYQNHRHLLSNDALLEAYAARSSQVKHQHHRTATTLT